MVTVKIDIDNDDPYLLARELFTMSNRECAIRLSSHKGTHMKIFDVTPSEEFSIRSRLDDQARFNLDIDRKKHCDKATTSVLWDKKDGKESGVWLHWRVRPLAFWLIRDTGRSLRDCITNLHTVLIMKEFSEVTVGLVNYP